MELSVKADLAKAMGYLNIVEREQIPFVTALALTTAAKRAQSRITDDLEVIFDRPRPFTEKAIGVIAAKKGPAPQAKVFLKRIQAGYLGLNISGGRRTPTKRAIVVPGPAIRRNKFGNMPRNAIKRLLARSDTFSGTVGGVPGIWRRLKRGGLRLEVRYVDHADYKPRFVFAPRVVRIVQQEFPKQFPKAMARAVATRR